VVLACGHQQIA